MNSGIRRVGPQWDVADARTTCSYRRHAVRARVDRGDGNTQRPSQSPSPGALGQSDLATLQTQIEDALDAVRRGHYIRALSTFDQLIPRVDNELKSILMYNRATCLFKLKRFDEAIIAFGEVANRGGQFEVLGSLNAGFAAVEAENVSTAVQWLSRARAARRTLPERYAILANAVHRLADTRRATLIDAAAQAESKGQFELAQRSYQQALNIQHARTAKQTSWLESRLKSLAERDEITANSKRSRQPVSLWVSSAAGYDSNVGRGSAHAGDISFLGVGEGAPIWVQSIEIDGRLVSRKRLRLSVGYMYDLYAVLDSELETLSDHYHEFESALGLQLTSKIDFRARVYGGVSAMALEAPEMYQWHLSAQLRFRLWHSRRNMTEFDVIGGRFAGLNDNDYLTGLHGRIDVGHRWMMGDYRLHAEARLRYRGAGDTAFELLATDLVACDARCDGGSYTVTYAYMSPDLGLSLQYAGWGAVRPRRRCV